MSETAPAAPYDFAFDRDAFAAAFTQKIQPLVVDEWGLEAEAVAETGGDPDKVIALVVSKTESSKALARKHLTEIVEVAGVKARGIEARLQALIGKLEDATAPVQARAAQTQEAIRERASQTQEAIRERASQTQEALRERAARTQEAFRELSEQGQHVIEEVRQVVPQAEEKVKENLWTALLAALGLGLLMGLVVGLSRGR